MIKTVQINDEKAFTMSNNLTWAMIYKNQFGHDIVPDIMPIFSALSKVFNELVKYKGMDINDVMKEIDGDVIQDALIELCALQFVDFVNLVWALVKANDKDTPAPFEWVSQFDEFPVDIIAPAVVELLGKGLISTKNLTSLRTTKPKA